MSFDIDSSFIETFKEEAAERIENLTNLLIRFETEPDNDDIMSEIKREAHTLKGSSKMVGLSEVSDRSHQMENILIELYEKKIDHGLAMTQVFSILDEISESLGFPRRGAPEEINVAVTSEAETGSTSGIGEGDEGVQNSAIGGPAGASSSTGTAEAQDGAQAENDQQETRSAAQAGLAKSGETMRVSISKIDKLINLTGETIIYQIQSLDDVGRADELSRQSRRCFSSFQDLELMLSRLGSMNGTRDAVVGQLAALKEHLRTLNHESLEFYRDLKSAYSKRDFLTRELQQTALSVRMLPVNSIYGMFPRAVREMAQRTLKEVSLVLNGGEIELDKKILESLVDPLVHIIRNAVDHGIEAPEVRMQNGKPKIGTLTISALQRGDHVELIIEDDGRGIDPEKLRRVAIEKQMIRPGDEPTREELINLLFRPGFSTSTMITDISGRGVGLDVVKKNLEELNGTVSIVSEEGKGTTFTLKIPFTLAITRVLFIRVSDEMFALPTTSVEETIRISADEVRTLQNKETVHIRDNTIPLASLSFVLGLSSEASVKRRAGKLPLVILRRHDQVLGLVVDELIGEQEVVVKNLKPPVDQIKEVSGATILGDGTVVLILDLSNVLERTRGMEDQISAAISEAEGEKKGAAKVLIADDSLITRELVRNILVTCGFEVDVAFDGIDAFEKALQKRYDLLLTDVNMPRLNGIDLTKKIKRDKKLGSTPVVIVSSKESNEDRLLGIEAGADAYITKGNFDQGDLLEVVERLIGR